MPKITYADVAAAKREAEAAQRAVAETDAACRSRLDALLSFDVASEAYADAYARYEVAVRAYSAALAAQQPIVKKLRRLTRLYRAGL